MKKIIFILVAVLVTTFSSYAQDRVDEITYNFISKSEIVSNITGWAYNNSEGKWIDNPNFIYGEKSSYLNDKRFSLGLNSIQIKSFNYNGVIKYVLIISFNGGHYRYPSIREDWRSYTEYSVFVLTNEQYNCITNPNDYIQFVLPCVTYDNYYDNHTDNWVIRAVIRNDEQKYNQLKNNHRLAIKKYKDVVRFIYAEDVSYNDVTMDKRYFEIPYNEWVNLSLK